MTLHKHWSRAQLVIDEVNSRDGRKLGKNQATVLKALLEHGDYPGGWYWQGRWSTIKTLESLHKRGLVTTQVVPLTDMRGEPVHGRTTTFYRPVPWMQNVMRVTEDEVASALKAAK